MATPGQMVQTMADVLGMPAATVSQYDRQLAEAGLRTTGGRGPSAAKVGATDAANLLIAILGSPVSGASNSSGAASLRNSRIALGPPKFFQHCGISEIWASHSGRVTENPHVPRSNCEPHRRGEVRRTLENRELRKPTKRGLFNIQNYGSKSAIVGTNRS